MSAGNLQTHRRYTVSIENVRILNKKQKWVKIDFLNKKENKKQPN